MEDFPGGPLVETSCFQCRGHGFSPWLGKFLIPHSVGKKKKVKETLMEYLLCTGTLPGTSDIMLNKIYDIKEDIF